MDDRFLFRPYIQEPIYFPFSRPYEVPHYNMNRTEEFMLPPSPNSTQSDSDNSISSIEFPSSEIHLPNSIGKLDKSEIICRWKSCGIYFPSLDQLANHVSKVHSASGLGGLFYCGWEGCTRNDKGFNARYKMLVHVRTHTNEKPHKCLQCNKSFSRAENLKIHSRSHSGEKPYVCPVPGCNKAYSNSSDRFKHTRTHQDEKPYQCKVPGCAKRYTDPSSLRKHVKTYKHFISEELKPVENPLARVETALEIMHYPHEMHDKSYRENVIKHPFNCNMMCCETTTNKKSDIFRIEALMNLTSSAKQNSKWNNVHSFVTEDSVIYTSYENYDRNMDVDGPLDLSMHNRNYYS